MSKRYHVAVIGAGPAGANAAIAVREHGLSCIVIDEAMAAGGQIYRAPAVQPPKRKAEIEDGNRLRSRLAASGAELAFGRRVWNVERGFAVYALGHGGALGDGGPERIVADRLIIATGATERVIPFPGWTTPGVIGLAAATILLKSQATLPGRRTLVAGRGPLLAAVATAILDLGGEVAALVDQSPRSAWLRGLPGLLCRPDLLARGIGWGGKLVARGVPIYHDTAVSSVEAHGDGLQVRLSTRERPVECDAMAVGHGLTPATEVTRLLGARHRYDAGMGGIVPELDEYGRSSIYGLYACGDGAGIRGAAAAMHAGRLAGLAAAHDSGHDSGHGEMGHGEMGHGEMEWAPMAVLATAESRSLIRARKFGAVMAGMMAPRVEDIARIAPATIVCRCEDVMCGSIRDAIDAGAREPNQLKAWTRCGMGPCQGRMCGETARALLAERTGEMPESWTVRVPLRPVPIHDLVGDYTYEGIPFPKAAPL